ncbi:MAG: PD40 domain-containing protein [Chloroflexi bacterium]|nr:PD40 domain-containing protein [Chloroflexota bacterium]
MNAGRTWKSELIDTYDPVTGARVRQLTDYFGHSNHFYFTYPCWYDNGRKLVIASDRENRTNFFGVDLTNGEMTQLTDLDPAEGNIGAQSMTKNPRREEIYFYQGKTVFALDLKTLVRRPLFTIPPGYNPQSANATADGNYLVTGYTQDLSDRFQVDLGHGYVGFREIWEAHPHCVIIRIALDTGAVENIFEDHCWLGHLNTSTTLPHIMTFCHEGPWDKVDNRIWGLNLQTRETWKIRATAPGERVGHEYWMDDGEHIGYHGYIANGTIYGSIRYDNTDQVEAPFEFHSWHFHSFRLDHVVGDGDAQNPYLLLWRMKDGKFEGPKALVWHRASFHTQRQHVHPCFSADGKQIVYTADPQGYGQVFIVDIPDWDALPDRNSLEKRSE